MKKLLLFVWILSIAGCAAQITEGEVISKEFVPEHEITVPVYDLEFNFKGFETETVPNKWYITFQKYGENDKLRARKVEVSQTMYNLHNVGDWISF
jgi:hypothetical protein